MDSRINQLILLIAKLPGLGPKSAKRIVLHLIKNKENLLLELCDKAKALYNNIKNCEICGNIDCQSPCLICINTKRDPSIICVVEELTDLWALERANIYNGKYHVLNGTLSAVNCVTPEMLNITALIKRLKDQEIKEIIIATNPTLAGQTTAQYIVEITKKFDIKLSFLAHGIPIGGELDYLDEGTLKIALADRKSL